MTAVSEPTGTSSRRAVLAGALAGVGAWAIGLSNRIAPAAATDGQPIVQGADNAGTVSTVVRVSTATAAIQGVSDATSGTPYGVRGRVLHSDGAGVVGVSTKAISIAPGVLGTTNSTATGGAGVKGIASDEAIGVWGRNTSFGAGVSGDSQTGPGIIGASETGIGVRAQSRSTTKPASLGISGSSTGVLGWSEPEANLPAGRPKTGVYGYAKHDSNSRGVWGESPAGRAVMGSTGSGYAGYFSGKVYTTKWYELQEITAPATPGTSRGRLFLRDSGGRTQLCVKFGNGQIKVLASET